MGGAVAASSLISTGGKEISRPSSVVFTTETGEVRDKSKDWNVRTAHRRRANVGMVAGSFRARPNIAAAIGASAAGCADRSKFLRALALRSSAIVFESIAADSTEFVMSVNVRRTSATRLRYLRTVALGALACSAAAQGAPVPVLIMQPDPPLADASVNTAKVYFYSPPSSLTAPSVTGNIITASLVPQPCSQVCGPSGYFGYWFVFPTVAAGNYRFKVVDGVHPSQVLQDFPLTIGGTTPNPPPWQIETIPAVPSSKQPFTIRAYFLPPYGASSLVTVDGIAVTTKYFACGFNECPPDIIYGPYSVTIPALLSGTHRLRFNNYYAPDDPPFAEFDVTVQGPDPVPAVRAPALLLLSLLLAGIARRHLRMFDSYR